MDIKDAHETQASIEKFYEGKSVLVTGGTGFIGKVLVEKLLYSCPKIKNIYLLIRENPKFETVERLKQMFNLPVFERLEKERPENMQKVIPITGDLTLSNLGLSERDEATIIQEVSCVFHCAANVKFNQPLKMAMNSIFDGTRVVLHLCRRIKNIEAFVYVSTAYSNTDQAVLEEVIYPPPASIDEVCKIIEHGNNEEVTSKLLRCRPNTYSFVKALTETLLEEEHDEVPTIIIRPSIVAASLNEPLKGWIENWFGATGLITTIAKGANRLLLTEKNHILDIIPVDYVVNLSIAAAAKMNGSKDVIVYNSCSGGANPLTMGEILRLIIEDSVDKKFCETFRPSCLFVQSIIVLRILAIVMETIPAFLFDCWLRFNGKPPRYMMMQTKVTMIRDSLQYFTSRSWLMRSSRVTKLFTTLSSTDQARFPFDPTHIKWSNYIPIYCMGIRKYLMNN